MMAHRCLRLLRVVGNGTSIACKSKVTSVNNLPIKLSKTNQFKTEDNFVYLEDPDQFGTLSNKLRNQEDILIDPGDVQEQEFIQNSPLPFQQLSIRQYADLIKQYLSHKRLREAIDVLEVRMLSVDRVKPENYIYNILIGACADVGYTKKAFKLFNDMKKRALKPTGDTYTCLFHACANSPWAADGLMHAKNLRTLMIEKGIEPNITNYNAMIKAFGRCGDVATAFQIVDEMIEKKIKIRVHTFNHLLHACIADKESGLRHALVVWRKMLKMREKPNLFSFNLMLRCVKDCNLGSKSDIEELIGILKDHIAIGSRHVETLQIESLENRNSQKGLQRGSAKCDVNLSESLTDDEVIKRDSSNDKDNVDIISTHSLCKDEVKVNRMVPNLLSKVVQMQQVLSLQEVHSVQDKFAVVGGQDDFLKEMHVYSVKPDIKTFTQMLPLIDNTSEAENTLLETMKSTGIRADIDFYNNLIKKRCFRRDYEGAFAVKDLLDEENRVHKKKNPMKKKFRLKFNIMTYGVLALACRTRESAEKLLNEMKENQFKANIEIFGTLLKNGAVTMQFEHVLYIMEKVKEENLKINEPFARDLAIFCEKCKKNIAQAKNPAQSNSAVVRASKNFLNVYKNWRKEINVEEALKLEHPWKQFQETYPETVQHSNVIIKEPKRFYKRNRKFVQYKAN